MTILIVPAGNPSINLNPSANDDIALTTGSGAASGNLLDNDYDPQGEPVFLSSIAGLPVELGVPTQITTASGGVLLVNENGEYEYQPAEGFVGTETITYTIDDGNGGTDTGTLSVSVFNAAPTLNVPENTSGNVTVDSENIDNLIVSGGDGEPVIIDLDEYLVDANGDQLRIDIESLPQGLSLIHI